MDADADPEYTMTTAPTMTCAAILSPHRPSARALGCDAAEPLAFVMAAARVCFENGMTADDVDAMVKYGAARGSRAEQRYIARMLEYASRPSVFIAAMSPQELLVYAPYGNRATALYYAQAMATAVAIPPHASNIEWHPRLCALAARYDPATGIMAPLTPIERGIVDTARRHRTASAD